MATFQVQAYHITYRTVEQICEEMWADAIWTYVTSREVRSEKFTYQDERSVINQAPEVKCGRGARALSPHYLANSPPQSLQDDKGTHWGFTQLRLGA